MRPFKLPQVEQEKLSQEEVGKMRKCPNEKCGAPIEKNEGCDHMTCKFCTQYTSGEHTNLFTGSRCRCEFCYVCSALYNGAPGIWRVGNSAHERSCPYYRDNLPKARAASRRTPGHTPRMTPYPRPQMAMPDHKRKHDEIVVEDDEDEEEPDEPMRKKPLVKKRSGKK